MHHSDIVAKELLVELPAGLLEFNAGMLKLENPELTERARRIMLLVYSRPEGCGVKELANELGTAKPVITRALNTLSSEGLLGRKQHPTDKRLVLVTRTSEGSEWVRAYSALWATIRA